MSLRILRTNLATNPRFQKTSGVVEVRRNLFPNPRGATGTGWSYAGGTATNTSLTGITDHPVGITTSRRVTWTESPQTVVGGCYFGTGTSQLPITPAISYMFSVWVRPSINQALRPLIEWKKSDNSSAGSNTGGVAVICPANVWTRLSVTGIAPADTAYANVTFYANDAAGAVIWPVGSTLDATGALAEATTILGPYLDGSYSPDPDLQPVWVGTENASQSYLRGFVPTNAGGYLNYSIASSYGARLIPFHAKSNDSSVTVGGAGSSLSGYGVTFTPGKWYGIQAVCTLLAPQIGTHRSLARRIHLVSNNVASWTSARSTISNQPPNEAGSYQAELVTQLPVDSVWAILRLYNGAPLNGGDVYWDKLLIVEGDSKEEVRAFLESGFFSGDTDKIVRPDGYEKRYAWLGEANGSQSVEYDWAPGILAGWTAKQTGLPSLIVTGPRTVYSGSRVVDVVGDETVIVSDPLAAPGENEYTDGETTITVSRRDDGHVVTDAFGRRVVHTAVIGNDQDSYDSGVVTFGNSNAVRWPIRRPKITGTLEVRTEGESTERLRELAQARSSLVVIHSQRDCQIPGCDISPVRHVLALGASSQRDGVVTSARRTWSIPWREQGDNAAKPAPVVTWGEYAAASDGKFTDESYEEICQRVGGMPA